MAWIKRNLYFVVGSALALALIGLAGWYLYSQWQKDVEVMGKLNDDYRQLGELNSQIPHPGDRKINNIDAAKKQRGQLLAFREKSRKYFQRIPPIPDLPKLTAETFSTTLSRTVSALQRDATNASISLPPGEYAFSFGSLMANLRLATSSIEPLSIQLGEVKTICDILFQAKINALDSIRRERASVDDQASSSTGDYLADKSITNANVQAVLSPYELTFRCFSQELGAVLAGFASSTNGLVIKSINVEAVPASAMPVEAPPPTPAAPVAPVYRPPSPAEEAARHQRESEDAAARYASRYGLGGPGDRMTRRPNPMRPPLVAPQPVPGFQPGTAPAQKSGLTTVLDERPLKVLLMLSVVKLEPKPELKPEPKPEPKSTAPNPK